MTAERSSTLRDHGLVSLAFLASRLVLRAMGLRFNFLITWMFTSDPDDLRHRLLETLYYFHAYPPGMNAMTGVLLKLGGEHADTLALVLFWGFGLLLVNGFFFCARVLGLSRRAAALCSLAFVLTPTVIYFEHLYLYEAPVTALLCLGTACFAKGLRDRSLWAWVACFGCAAAVGFIRSTFHLTWFAAMVGLGVWLVPGRERRRVLAAASGPALALLALYAKNWLVFGFFGASSAAVANLNLVTVAQLKPEVRAAWVAEHKLSPLANISVFAGPSAYLSLFPSPNDSRFPEQLSRLERPTVHAPNFNHWFYLALREQRRSDSLHYLAARPLEYVETVLSNLRALFGPSTIWHPGDASPDAPDAQHRRVLGGYERLYNAVLHGFPLRPVGLYLFLPLPCLIAFRRARALARARSGDGVPAAAGLVYLLLFEAAYVVLTSSAFSARESSRYRYAAEPMIWLLVAFCFARRKERAALQRA
jgi:4-amino-4-deoxy-L-arabinose transferase-like glycosyltransferase